MAFYLRLKALIHKENNQLLRDKSSLVIGLVLPIILILLFGYGLSFDLSLGRVAVVEPHKTPQSNQFIADLNATNYIVAEPYESFPLAEEAMGLDKLDAIIHLPSDFANQLKNGNVTIQLITNGRSTNISTPLQGYISSALAITEMKQINRSNLKPPVGNISVEQRIWFNESANSTWYLVPGLIVLILTLIGAFLTALLIVREKERGTLEPLFVSPIRPLEIVISKLVPYIFIGMIDIAICLLAAYFIFDVPIRGSLLSIISSSFLYLLVSLLLGLAISGLAQNQFDASQIALLVSFVPALMLSGFVFDLDNSPFIVQVVSQTLPATHFMSLIKTLFLGGDDWVLWLKECSILMIYIVILTIVSCRSLRKRLD